MDVICCVEGGEDLEFFLPHVQRELGLHRSRMDFVKCSGKSTVLTLWIWSVEKNWNLSRLGFFVDRDIDDFLDGNLSGAQLYVTDYYSIESHVIDEQVFDVFWQDIFHLSLSDERYGKWRQNFYIGADKLAEIMRKVSWLAIATKLAGGAVDFERINLSDYMKIIDEGQIISKGNVGIPTDAFMGFKPKFSHLKDANILMTRASYRSWLRGKFLLSYFITFMARMKAVLGERKVRDRVVVRLPFNADTAMSCLCGRASPPASLVSFLRSWSQLILNNGLLPSEGRATPAD
nr:DUF4435 domain-containing protein [Xanthomonas sp. MWU16-30325]